MLPVLKSLNVINTLELKSYFFFSLSVKIKSQRFTESTIQEEEGNLCQDFHNFLFINSTFYPQYASDSTYAKLLLKLLPNNFAIPSAV